METKVYKGLLHENSWGEADDILFLSSLEDPLAEVLQDDISGKIVTARYYITDKEATLEDAKREFLKELVGAVDIEFGSRYSEITGYLWTDEEINIGGHDLMAELHSFVGKWLILLIDIHD